MQRLPTLSIALAAVLVAFGPPAVSEISEVSVTPLKGSLYLLRGRGGNVVASVGEDGILLVDDDYTEQAPAYRDALDRLDSGRRVPRFVINTHWHADHVGGNGYWGERGSVVIAHTNVRQRMSVRQEMPVLDRVVEASPPVALPVVTYGD